MLGQQNINYCMKLTNGKYLPCRSIYCWIQISIKYKPLIITQLASLCD